MIAKFRNNDLKYNGCGAPLAPIYHKYLIKKTHFRFLVALLILEELVI